MLRVGPIVAILKQQTNVLTNKPKYQPTYGRARARPSGHERAAPRRVHACSPCARRFSRQWALTIGSTCCGRLENKVKPLAFRPSCRLSTSISVKSPPSEFPMTIHCSDESLDISFMKSVNISCHSSNEYLVERENSMEIKRRSVRCAAGMQREKHSNLSGISNLRLLVVGLRTVPATEDEEPHGWVGKIRPSRQRLTLISRSYCISSPTESEHLV